MANKFLFLFVGYKSHQGHPHCSPQLSSAQLDSLARKRRLMKNPPHFHPPVSGKVQLIYCFRSGVAEREGHVYAEEWGSGSPGRNARHRTCAAASKHTLARIQYIKASTEMYLIKILRRCLCLLLLKLSFLDIRYNG